MIEADVVRLEFFLIPEQTNDYILPLRMNITVQTQSQWLAVGRSHPCSESVQFSNQSSSRDLESCLGIQVSSFTCIAAQSWIIGQNLQRAYISSPPSSKGCCIIDYSC